MFTTLGNTPIRYPFPVNHRLREGPAERIAGETDLFPLKSFRVAWEILLKVEVLLEPPVPLNVACWGKGGPKRLVSPREPVWSALSFELSWAH